MKIIRPPKKILFDYRKSANEGCETCPYCKLDGKYDKETGSCNIRFIGSYPYIEYIGNLGTHFTGVAVDRYECKECGASWQSEPYRYKEAK